MGANDAAHACRKARVSCALHVRSRQSEAPAEFTLRAVVTGVVLGIVFGAANAYLGLRVGMTVSASIPAAVMTVALFRSFALGAARSSRPTCRRRSARPRPSLATGTIFTIPALFLWGMAPPYLQVVVLCFLGARARALRR